jgi:hypothetical protein
MKSKLEPSPRATADIGGKLYDSTWSDPLGSVHVYNDTIFFVIFCRAYAAARRVLTKRQTMQEAVKQELQDQVMQLKTELVVKMAIYHTIKEI